MSRGEVERIEDQVLADLPRRLLPLMLIVLVLFAMVGCSELRNTNHDVRDFFGDKERWSGGSAE